MMTLTPITPETLPWTGPAETIPSTTIHQWRRRAILAAATFVLGAALLWVSAPFAAAGTGNPLGGITPNITLFGGMFNDTWKRVVSAIWGGILAYCAVLVIIAGAKARQARKAGMAGGLTDSHEEFMTALLGFGLVACASLITGAVLFATGV